MAETTLQWQRYLLLVRYNFRFLLLTTIGGLVLGGILALFILHPIYSSDGKLLIKGGRANTFVTQLQSANTQDEIRPLTMNGNPLLTQIEVLNSLELAQKVLDQLKRTLPKKQYEELERKYPNFFQPRSLVKALKLKNPASTDVVTLHLSTPDRTLSARLIQLYLREYQQFLREINHESLRQHGQYIEAQIASTEDKLRQVRQQLMAYRRASQTIDLSNEAQANIQQISNIETNRITLDSQISAREGNVQMLRQLLGMTARQGIQSVAMGMNPAMTEAQKNLNAALQEYKTLSVKYTDENPTMQALKARINEIQSQIATEARRTAVGSRRGIPKTYISDNVRSNLVDNLAQAEADLRGLRAQRAALDQDLGQLKSRIQQFPEKQLRLAELTDSEQVLSEMVNMLRMKAAEAEFQASDSLSNVVVIQHATWPFKPDFPTPKQIQLMMTLLGFMTGLGWLVFLDWARMQALRPMHEQLQSERERERSHYSG